MATKDFETENVALNVNFAQISFDSSGKVVDILSKCTYENNNLKRVVGAVTIIFTDNGTDGVNDTNNSGPADEFCNGKLWRNIPSSISVLPSPGCRYVGNQGISSSVQFGPESVEYQTNTQQIGVQNWIEKNKNACVDNSLNVCQGQSKPVSTSSSEQDEHLIYSEGETIFVKQEAMSPPADMEYDTEDNLQESGTSLRQQEPLELQEIKDRGSNLDHDLDDIRQSKSGKFSLSNCSVCFREIQNRKDFTFHVKAHKNVLGTEENCPVCLKTFQRRMDLIRHSFMHFSNDLYCCPVCQINIGRLDSFKRHFHKRHPASLPKLRRYLANFRHNVSRQISEETEKNGQSIRDGFIVKRGLSQVNMEMTRRNMPGRTNQATVRLPALRGIRLDKRKQLIAQKMQLDVDDEGVQGVNIIIEQDNKPYVGTNSEEESGGTNKTKCSKSRSGNPKSKKTSKCSFCWSEMADLEDFVNHMEAHKAMMKVPYTCPVCLHEFSDKMRVKRHASKHVQTAMYVCPLCKIQIPRVDSFRRHVKKVHPTHADDVKVLIKYSMFPSGPTESIPETCSVPASYSDTYSLPLSTSEQLNVKQEITSHDFCSIPSGSENSFVKQDVSYSENDSYTDYCPVHSPAQESVSDIQGYQDQFAMTSDSLRSFSETQMQHDQTDITWQLDTDQQHPQRTDDPLVNTYILKNENEPTSVPETHNTGGTPSATFHAPKRGGYRQAKAQLKQEQSPSKSSPAASHGTPGKKKSKKKDLSSVCFFCSAVLTNTQEFLEHARQHAKGDKITCPVCVTDYARKLGLVRHSVNHVPSDAHICDICGTSFARRDVMLRHYRKVHKITPDYVRQDTFPKGSGSYQITCNPYPEELPVLSFDSISAPSIPPMPGESDSQISTAGALSLTDDEDMMYSCGLCGAQYHDAQTLQDHVQNHPHDI